MIFLKSRTLSKGMTAAVVSLLGLKAHAASTAAWRACPVWGEPEILAPLDPMLLAEASGLAIAKRHPNVFYHVNDSGDGAFLYATDLSKRKTVKLSIAGYVPTDIEDLTAAPCGGNDCIIIADIGDNKLSRDSLTLVILEEPTAAQLAASHDELKPLKIIKTLYPDGPRNAESLAAYPNGDLFLVTKEKAKKNEPLTASIYHLQHSLWQGNQPGEKSGKSAGSAEPVPLTWTAVGSIKFADPALGKSGEGPKATSMDIHPQGGSFMLMTYGNAVEFGVDLSKARLGREINEKDRYRIVNLLPLPKQESLTFAADGRSFYYTSEYNPKKVAKAKSKNELMHQAALVKVACQSSP